jgi:hypothetical protein
VIVALDLRTGRTLWKHKPKQLGTASFAVFPEGLAVYGLKHEKHNRHEPLFFSPTTGKRIGPFDYRGFRRLARSASFAQQETLRLSNGWELVRYFRSRRALVFAPPGAILERRTRLPKEIAWEIPTHGRPAWIQEINETLLLSQGPVMVAYRIGAKKPLWSRGFQETVGQWLETLRFRVLEGRLFVQAHRYLMELDLGTGKILSKRDLAADLELQWSPGLVSGMSPTDALLTMSDGILVVAFNRRVIALDLKAGRYLWHLDPGDIGAIPRPLAHKGILYLTVDSEPKVRKVQNKAND